MPPRTGPPKYERNTVGLRKRFMASAARLIPPQLLEAASQKAPAPSHNPPQQQAPPSAAQHQPAPPGVFQNSRSNTFSDSAMPPQNQGSLGHSYGQSMGSIPLLGGPPRPPSQPQHERSFSHSSAVNQGNGSASQQYRGSGPQPPQPSNPRFNGQYNSAASQGPPQLGALPFQTSQPQQQQQSSYAQLPSQQAGSPSGPPQQPPSMVPPPQAHRQSPPVTAPQMAPPRPMFGVALSRLYERDGLAVPMVVYQCIQAVDLFGLNVEGIYRLSGSVPHVNKLKNLFDTSMFCCQFVYPLEYTHTFHRLRFRQPRLPQPRELLPRRQQCRWSAQAVLPGSPRSANDQGELLGIYRSSQ